MVNYQNAKIYKIVNDELNFTYYGSTCNTLTKRLSGHKSDYLRGKTCSSLILFQTETKPKIFLVEKFPCKDKSELHQRERFYIENNECINKVIPNRTKREYQLNNHEKYLKYQKNYNDKNKEIKKELYKLNYEKNKDEINKRRRERYKLKK